MRDVDANGKVDRVLATFSETLRPRPTPPPGRSPPCPSAGSLASVSTSGATATLVLDEGAGAQYTAVGTFRVVLAASATGIRDAAGNQASFASTAPVDQATPVLVTLAMQDVNTNGKVDRVVATFSETLAAYSAGTAPWTLANVPSGGTLSSVSVSGTTATLTIAEGAGAPDTAVGSFSVALADGATGIRDAAGNLSSFAASAPTDAARPVLVAGTLLMRDVDANGKVDRVLATFSETLCPPPTPPPGRSPPCPQAAPSPPSPPRERLRRSSCRGRRCPEHRCRHLPRRARRERDRHPRCRRQPGLPRLDRSVDQATPVLVTLAMQDVNTNGKVDRVLATFSETLAAYSAGTAPWTLGTCPRAEPRLGRRSRGRSRRSTIAEGAGAPDTAVGSFTVALATSATGIRDAAGNLSSFAASAPSTARGRCSSRARS